jgi:hypothetical protein
MQRWDGVGHTSRAEHWIRTEETHKIGKIRPGWEYTAAVAAGRKRILSWNDIAPSHPLATPLSYFPYALPVFQILA